MVLIAGADAGPDEAVRAQGRPLAASSAVWPLLWVADGGEWPLWRPFEAEAAERAGTLQTLAQGLAHGGAARVVAPTALLAAPSQVAGAAVLASDADCPHRAGGGGCPFGNLDGVDAAETSAALGGGGVGAGDDAAARGPHGRQPPADAPVRDDDALVSVEAPLRADARDRRKDAAPSPSAAVATASNAATAGDAKPRANTGRARRGTNWRYCVYLFVAGSLLFAHESHYSRLQAYVLARVSEDVAFEVRPGAALNPAVPDQGTFDVRLGYAQLPDYIARAQRTGMAITSQAQPSTRAQLLKSLGLFQIYDEKRQAGLDIRDRDGNLIYSARHPGRVYGYFDAVPPLVASSLLYVEDRELLRPSTPLRNPVVDWERLIKAVVYRAVEDDRLIGASTLATQIEKVRHSPEGRTVGASEKLRQMATASVRVYRAGEDTRAARRQLVADYLDNLPLAARPRHGEVWGLGDGLELWYGTDFEAANAALHGGDPKAAALPFKQALSLILSARRPSHYLAAHPEQLESFTDSYLRVLAAGGAISPALRDEALAVDLDFAPFPDRQPIVFTDRKGANLVRSRLQTLFGLPSLYPLDRLDLAVGTTLDQEANAEATKLLNSLKSDEVVKQLGLDGFRLLAEGKPEKVIYSLALFERTDKYNVLRVNVDNFDQPFDINTGSRLDLGSTAKLRTLVTWMELIAEAHARWAALDADALRTLDVHARDDLGEWVRARLIGQPGLDLESLLRLAIDRQFSANPAAAFFTGGGQHRFVNFDAADNGRVMSVREALAQSVNLVFIRMMREVVNHIQFRDPDAAARALVDASDVPLRESYLRKFADREGQKFMRDFYVKYANRDADAQMALLLGSHTLTPTRLATIVRSVAPELDAGKLQALARTYLPDSQLSAAEVASLHERYAIDKFSLSDRGYLARVHPLELWLLNYLRANPGASMAQAIAAGEDERQEVYRWLFKTSRKQAQDKRIQTLLEIEAFLEVHQRWQRLGYPFETLTPSLATAIGSSADRPAALGELLGIIVNGGLRVPTVLIDHLHFGANTIYETTLDRLPASGERVLAPEVARVLHEAMLGVVETGTARALGTALNKAGMSTHVIGGKTGTGDHRFDVYGPRGRTIESRVVNRTAIFAFFIDDRFFGTIIAFVPGQTAAQYEFTSGLPVRVLGALLPRIRSLIDCPAGSRGTFVPAPEAPAMVPEAVGTTDTGGSDANAAEPVFVCTPRTGSA